MRLGAFTVTVVAAFTILAGRVLALATVGGERYVERGLAQAVRSTVLAADRGDIVDRNGNALATSVPMRTVYTDPKFVVDPDGTATRLADLLGGGADRIRQILTADNRFGYIARQIDPDVAARIEQLRLPGVYVVEEPARVRPGGDSAVGVVGLTDIDSNGIAGLELQYEDELAGVPGRLTVERDPSGRVIPAGERRFTPPVPGRDLVLTLDRSIQDQAEVALRRRVEAVGAKAGMAVVMVPGTGEVLAMASVDRDRRTGETRVSPDNMVLTNVYEPGSVMKVVTVSGALEEGVVSTTGCIPAPDSLQIANKTFTEYKPHGGGCWPLADVIAKSSNTASINVALRLGDEQLYGWFKRFGLGSATGLGFPNEQSGYVRPVEEWWSTSIGSMAIGQGISVTPLQLLLAVNVVANDGEWVAPKLVDAIVDEKGRRHLSPPVRRRRVLSGKTAGTMRSLLSEVVERGTGEAAAVPGLTVCGKTGTALKPYNGGYVGPEGRTEYMATFAGFAPCEGARISAIVVIDDPRGGAYTGGAVSAPVWSEIVSFAARRLALGGYEAEVDQPVRARPTLPADTEDGTPPVSGDPTPHGVVTARGND